MAADLKALMLVLETRFFGESQPTESWELTNMKYLNLEQVLGDVAYFIDAVNRELDSKFGVSNGRKWYTVGAGFGGTLAAYARMKYPHYIEAAWSVSGTLEFVEDFSAYDAFLGAQLDKTEGCLSKIQTLTNEAYSSFGTDLLNTFGADSTMSQDDFMYYFAEITNQAVLAGETSDYCTALVGDSDTDTCMTTLANYATYFGISPQEYD